MKIYKTAQEIKNYKIFHFPKITGYIHTSLDLMGLFNKISEHFVIIFRGMGTQAKIRGMSSNKVYSKGTSDRNLTLKILKWAENILSRNKLQFVHFYFGGKFFLFILSKQERIFCLFESNHLESCHAQCQVVRIKKTQQQKSLFSLPHDLKLAKS